MHAHVDVFHLISPKAEKTQTFVTEKFALIIASYHDFIYDSVMLKKDDIDASNEYVNSWRGNQTPPTVS